MLVSKPPAAEVAAEIEELRRRRSARRSQLALLGAGQPDLTAAAEAVLRAAGPRRARRGRWPARPAAPAGGRWLRGPVRRRHACDEAMLIASRSRAASNIPLDPLDARRRPGHDGIRGRLRRRRADTAGRAHPMIDPTLRLEHLAPGRGRPGHRRCCCSTSCSGTAPSPTRPALLAPAAGRASGSPVVVAVVGTARRPAGPATARPRALADAGAEVHLSNAGATRRAVDAAREAADEPATPTAVVTAGADLFADALADQAVAGHPGRLAPADAGHRGRPGRRGRRPAPRGRQRAGAGARCSAVPAHAGRRRAGVRGCSGWSGDSSCTPARRSTGTAPPARCAAR